MIPKFLYGERGERPVSIRLLDASQATQVARAFPGAINKGRYINCTWDVQAQVYAAVGYSAKPLPDPNPIINSLDIDRFEKMELGKKLRKYQIEGALFLAQRSGVMTADEMRLGKTHQAIAASVLAGSRKTLIIAPAMVRRVWPKTIAWLTGAKTLLLEGRAGKLGRIVCDCLMVGCDRCKQKGYIVVKGDACEQALTDAEFVFVNYDILQPQYRRDDAKMMQEDPNLPGWGRKLAGMKWDTAVGDECLVIGSLVETRRGLVPIQNVVIGDEVRSWHAGQRRFVWRRVWRTTMRPAPDRLVQLWTRAGGRLALTDMHDVLVERREWRSACGLATNTVLSPTDDTSGLWRMQFRLRTLEERAATVEVWPAEASALLSSMQKRAQAAGRSRTLGSDARTLRELRNVWQAVSDLVEEIVGTFVGPQPGAAGVSGVLFGDVSNGVPTQDWRSQRHAREQRTIIRTNAAEQSDVRRGDTQTGFDDLADDRARTVNSRRQRSRAITGADVAVRRALRTFGRVGRRVFGSDKEASRGWLPDALLDRHRIEYRQDRDRGRRLLTQGSREESIRREEDGVSDFARLDRIEILERGSDGRFESVCPDGLVYNLEVEETENFVAEGFVVHNSHRFRGWSTASAKAGKRRFDFIQLVTDSARQVILATGTPIATYVRDLYTQLDVMTKGASAGGWKRTPFSWQVAYADADHDEETGYWVSTGLSARALLEVGPRMGHLMIRRLQKDVFDQLPPKSEEVLRLPASKTALKASRAALLGRGNSRDRIKKALVATTDAKMTHILDPICELVQGGGKGLVLVYLKEARRKLTAELQKRLENWDPLKHDPKKMPRVFGMDGDISVDKRLKLAEDYVDHGGGAIAVATMDSVTEGISLKGGTVVWFLDLHDVPATISQVSQRIWDPEMPSMSIIYCVMEGAADDRYIIGLRKKIKAQETIGDTSLSGFADQVRQRAIDFDDLLGDMIASVQEESGRDLDDELRELGVEI